MDSMAGRQYRTTRLGLAQASGRINTQWFVGKLQSQAITQKALAAALNIDPSSVSLMLHGKRTMDIREAAVIAKLIGVPMSDVALNAGIALPDVDDGKEVLIKGWVDAGYTVRWEAPKGPRKVQAPRNGGPNLVCLRIQTAGQSVNGLDGALIFYRVVSGPLNVRLGQICITRVQGSKETCLRVIQRGYETGTFNLYTFGGELKEEGVVLEMAHPVVYFKMSD